MSYQLVPVGDDAPCGAIARIVGLTVAIWGTVSDESHRQKWSTCSGFLSLFGLWQTPQASLKPFSARLATWRTHEAVEKGLERQRGVKQPAGSDFRLPVFSQSRFYAGLLGDLQQEAGKCVVPFVCPSSAPSRSCTHEQCDQPRRERM